MVIFTFWWRKVFLEIPKLSTSWHTQTNNLGVSRLQFCYRRVRKVRGKHPVVEQPYGYCLVQFRTPFNTGTYLRDLPGRLTLSEYRKQSNTTLSTGLAFIYAGRQSASRPNNVTNSDVAIMWTIWPHRLEPPLILRTEK